MASKELWIVDEYGERRFIGHVWGQTLHMGRKKSIHFFRNLQAWALDEDVYKQNPDVLVFVLTDKENNIKYLASRRDFELYAKPIQFGGHLRQLALPIQYWAPFK